MEFEDIPDVAPGGPLPFVIAAEGSGLPFAAVDGARLRRGPGRLWVELPVGDLWARAVVTDVPVGSLVSASCGELLDGLWNRPGEVDPERSPVLHAALRREPVVVPYFELGFPVRLVRLGRVGSEETLAVYLLNGAVADTWKVALQVFRPVCAGALAALREGGVGGEVGQLLAAVDDPAGMLGLRDQEPPRRPRSSWR